MMSELTRLRDDATRLMTVYDEYKDSEFYDMRRKAHLDLDKFLMEHRETAILLMVDGLNAEIDKLVKSSRNTKTTHKPGLLKRLFSPIIERRNNTNEYQDM